MIAKLLIGLLNLIAKVVGILLFPIDALLVSFLPDVSNVLTNITYYMNLPFQVMGWLFSLLHIPSACFTLIVSYWVFKYAITGAASGIKLAITLYQKFKL